MLGLKLCATTISSEDILKVSIKVKMYSWVVVAHTFNSGKAGGRGQGAGGRGQEAGGRKQEAEAKLSELETRLVYILPSRPFRAA